MKNAQKLDVRTNGRSCVMSAYLELLD